jgi:hypothetical protein
MCLVLACRDVPGTLRGADGGIRCAASATRPNLIADAADCR